MPGRDRPEELFAIAVLERVLRIVVMQRDDGSTQRMVDALFSLPDGRLGALEVTTIGEQAALERDAIAAKGDWRVDGVRWAWMVHVGSDVSMRALREHLPALLLTCEQYGLTDPRPLSRDTWLGPAFDWFAENNDLKMHGFPESARPGAIDVLPDGNGGAVFEHLDELPGWVEARLRQADLAEKVDKLHNTGLDELHLFLRIHDTAMPFSLYYPLASGDYIPADQLDAPDGLTGVWLVPAWKNPILWWRAGAGWRRENCLD